MKTFGGVSIVAQLETLSSPLCLELHWILNSHLDIDLKFNTNLKQVVFRSARTSWNTFVRSSVRPSVRSPAPKI